MKKIFLLLAAAGALLFAAPSARADITYTGHECYNITGGGNTAVSCTINNTGDGGGVNVFTVQWASNAPANADTSMSVVTASDANGSATCIPGTRFDPSNPSIGFAFASIICYINNIASNAADTISVNITNGSGTTFYPEISAVSFLGQASSSLIVDQAVNQYSGSAVAGPTTVTASGITATFNYTSTQTVWGTAIVILKAASGLNTAYASGQIYGVTVSAGSGYTELLNLNHKGLDNEYGLGAVSTQIGAFIVGP